MTYNMENEDSGTFFRWTVSQWPRTLMLARMYGWEPYGTLLPDGYYSWPDRTCPIDWNGAYTARGSQAVCPEDASNLANALEKAMDDITDVHVKRIRADESQSKEMSKVLSAVVYRKLDEDEWEAISDYDRDHRSLREFWSGPNKRLLRRFLEFCKAGEFRIR